MEQANPVKSFRVSRKWPQERLAEELGVNVSTVWRWENRNPPTKGPIIKAIERLAEQHPPAPGAAI